MPARRAAKYDLPPLPLGEGWGEGFFAHRVGAHEDNGRELPQVAGRLGQRIQKHQQADGRQTLDKRHTEARDGELPPYGGARLASSQPRTAAVPARLLYTE